MDFPNRHSRLPGRGIENTPLVVDGILYVTGNNNEAWAIDGRTGRPIWITAAGCLPISLPRFVAARSIADLEFSAIGCTWARWTRISWRSTAKPAKSSGT